MKPKNKVPQGSFFNTPLKLICDEYHPLYQVSDQIDWEALESWFLPMYSLGEGRPAKAIRLMIGLHYLKAMFGESDESVVAKWVENPYWQYFCGETEFQHEFPIEPTSMVKWRKRVEKEGLAELLAKTIDLGLKVKAIEKRDLARVNVDTTVMEKAISYPTDAKLMYKMLMRLLRISKEHSIKLRQSYKRKAKASFIMQHRYRHARQGKRANREMRRLRTYLGRVTRDLSRQIGSDERVQAELRLANRLLEQQRSDKNKIYSLHAPEVECIAKGKAHKKYEFGVKLGLVTTSKRPFVLASMALPGNPYDGHRLEEIINEAKRHIGKDVIENVYADQGYRGHNLEDSEIEVHIVKRGMRKVSRSLRYWLKRRSAIEPVIGHMKNDNGFRRNHLLGQSGDRMNAILMACGYNLRRCLAAILFYFKILTAHFHHQNQNYQILPA
jgi:IS5 family transposase